MKKQAIPKILETDLYRPIHDYLAEQGYTVHSEVKNCDIVAKKGDELVIIELKRNFNAELLLQATQRQRASDSVYVAIPKPKGGTYYTKNWQHICHLLRRLELGLILVSFNKPIPSVEIAFHPEPFDREKSRKKGKHIKISILKEMEGRYGNYNEGGSCRRSIMTAYRENSIQIACFLDIHGPMSPSALKKIGTGEKTQSILSKNFYNWFEKQAKGIYGLSEQGKEALKGYLELVEHYRTGIKK